MSFEDGHAKRMSTEIRGVLRKQCGFLGFWYFKYFVLAQDTLIYFNSESNYKKKKSCETFPLKPSTVLVFTKTSLVFKVITDEDKICLIAENYDDLTRWTNGLQSAISELYVKSQICILRNQGVETIHSIDPLKKDSIVSVSPRKSSPFVVGSEPITISDNMTSKPPSSGTEKKTEFPI